MTVNAETINPAGRRIRASDPVWGEVVDFFTDEANLLDGDQHLEWLELLTDDIEYKMPVRKTLYRRDGNGFDDHNNHFDDDRLSLGLRVRRSVEISSAYDRDPAPRIRRLITNVAVYESEESDEYAASSSILLLRNRFNAPTYEMLSGRREDVLRRTPDGMRLARRTVYLDQSALGSSFLNVFM
jgi:3-phenylpropionate/cinnamic acid dioxygenase small subunit